MQRAGSCGDVGIRRRGVLQGAGGLPFGDEPRNQPTKSKSALGYNLMSGISADDSKSVIQLRGAR